MESVFEIYRQHWIIPSIVEMKKRQNQKFIDYMKQNCNNNDIVSFSYESSPDGIIEAISYLSNDLLKRYNFPVFNDDDFYCRSMVVYSKFSAIPSYSYDSPSSEIFRDDTCIFPSPFPTTFPVLPSVS